MSDLKYRDKILTNYILKRNWDVNDDLEFKLVVECIKIQKNAVKKYKGNPPKRSIIQKKFIVLDNNNKNIGHIADILMKYPFIYDYEWFVEKNYSNMGRGDIVLTNGKNEYLIIEFKYIDKSLIGRTQRVKRTRKRKEVKEQALFYKNSFKKLNPNAKCIAIAYTNEGIYLV